MVNVLGDAFGSGIVEHLSQKELTGGSETKEFDVDQRKSIDKQELITEL